MKCREIIECLEQLSPKSYACDWDNVGLLVGRKDKEVERIMVALDATKEIINLAERNCVDMLITHHPMIFSSVKQINDDDFIGEKILSLAENGICYYAMHTNFDAIGGMAELATGKKFLNLTQTSPVEVCDGTDEGMGRYGTLPYPMKAEEVCEYVKERFQLPFVMLYQAQADEGKVFEKIAVMPGSGKSYTKQVLQNGYELYLTGDFGHHEGVDAMDMGLTVIDATHYGLEKIFVSYITSYLEKNYAELTVFGEYTGVPMQVL